jgi:hypothetical protein
MKQYHSILLCAALVVISSAGIAAELVGSTASHVRSILGNPDDTRHTDETDAWRWIYYKDGSYTTISFRDTTVEWVKYGEAVVFQSLSECGRVCVGMNSDQVIQAIGRPDKTRSSISAAGRRESWFYDPPATMFLPLEYVTAVFMEAGICTSYNTQSSQF